MLACLLGLSPLGSGILSNDPVFLKKEIASLNKELELLRDGKYEDAWKERLNFLEDKVAQLEAAAKTSSTRSKLDDAKAMDKQLSS